MDKRLRPSNHTPKCNCIRCRDTELDGSPRWCKPLIRQAKKNAMKRGIEFNLTSQEFAVLVTRSEGHCEVSGVPFDMSAANGMRRPFAASLDRIDSAMGYSFENCRMVCVLVNIALNEWGLDPLLQVARCLVNREKQLLAQSEPADWQTIRSFCAAQSIVPTRDEMAAFQSVAAKLRRAGKIKDRWTPSGDARDRLVRSYPKSLLEEAYDLLLKNGFRRKDALLAA